MERGTIWGEEDEEREDEERVPACVQANNRAPGRLSVAGLEPNHSHRRSGGLSHTEQRGLGRGMIARGYSGTVLVHFSWTNQQRPFNSREQLGATAYSRTLPIVKKE